MEFHSEGTNAISSAEASDDDTNSSTYSENDVLFMVSSLVEDAKKLSGILSGLQKYDGVDSPRFKV